MGFSWAIAYRLQYLQLAIGLISDNERRFI